ncbi:LysR family transcriptional regulator [Cognatiyoonia sp. IB215446]|uniref:LysR family transcriptional regulator n=1 Tax=Cognatiyoonia sp. IB215446 TaxID=3097355 RepID=UPI002A10990C|nr:LysR family transcriptional regulator [Cognatiyoonia sp. IB215446]MDX8348597.1 LysR family transcriptional regulator [Cognatiyoonia sp. IB215446]
MKTWTEIHSAYCVAKEGTVSKAAEVLGVHRATVNRHIETLEKQLGVRLFIRHRRGYHLTEAGQEFFSVAGRAHDILDDFAGRVRVQSSELSGEVIVTTLFPISNVLMPAFRSFRHAHPKTRVSLLADVALLKLEHAEAHIALRAGRKPENEDYVVQPYCQLRFGLFAHTSYLEKQGTPRDLDDLAHHDFVGNPRKRSSAPFEAWLADNVQSDRVVFRTADALVLEQAIKGGLGLGFLPVAGSEAQTDLYQIGPSLDEWTVHVWLVTHVDLHRTEKVQAMLSCLKALEF